MLFQCASNPETESLIWQKILKQNGAKFKNQISSALNVLHSYFGSGTAQNCVHPHYYKRARPSPSETFIRYLCCKLPYWFALLTLHRSSLSWFVSRIFHVLLMRHSVVADDAADLNEIQEKGKQMAGIARLIFVSEGMRQRYERFRTVLPC